MIFKVLFSVLTDLVPLTSRRCKALCISFTQMTSCPSLQKRLIDSFIEQRIRSHTSLPILRFGEVVSFSFDTHPLTNILNGGDQLITVIASGFIGPNESLFNCRFITFQCLEQVLENRNNSIPIVGAAIKVMYVRLNGISCALI